MWNSLSLFILLEMSNGLFIKRSLREANLTYKRISPLIKAIYFSRTIYAEVVLAEKDKQIFWPLITNGTSFLGIHRYI